MVNGLAKDQGAGDEAATNEGVAADVNGLVLKNHAFVFGDEHRCDSLSVKISAAILRRMKKPILPNRARVSIEFGPPQPLCMQAKRVLFWMNFAEETRDFPVGGWRCIAVCDGMQRSPRNRVQIHAFGHDPFRATCDVCRPLQPGGRGSQSGSFATILRTPARQQQLLIARWIGPVHRPSIFSQVMSLEPIDPKQFVELVEPILARHDVNGLLSLVKSHWSPEQVRQLLRSKHDDARKVALLALALVGPSCCCDELAFHLRDPDPLINQLAEHALWAIWFRCGKTEQSNQMVCRGAEAVEAKDFPPRLGAV
jgi:hypothetical protein